MARLRGCLSTTQEGQKTMLQKIRLREDIPEEVYLAFQHTPIGPEVLQNDIRVSLSDFLEFFGYGDGGRDPKEYFRTVYFRTFTDNKSKVADLSRDGSKKAVDFDRLPALEKQLREENAAGRGVYFVVNGGGQSDAEVKYPVAQFMEMDEGTFEEQLELINQFPLPPSLIVKTKKSLHTYWLLYEDRARIDYWKPLQERLIYCFDSDKSVKNPSKVMRVPGFNHCKQDPPVPVKLIYVDMSAMYTQRDFDTVLPLIPAQTAPAATTGTAAAGPVPGGSAAAWGNDLNQITRDISCIWVEDWAQKYGVEIRSRHVAADGTAVMAVTCPWADEHTDNTGPKQTAILIKPDGVKCFNCFHSHCLDRTWTDYRQKVEDMAGPDLFPPQAAAARKEQGTAAGGAEEGQKAPETAAPDPLTAFAEKIQTEAYKPFSTGLAFFDRVLDGGPIPQTVSIIMAAPGTGKTTLCQQIAEGIAARGTDTIYFNLEMSGEQMIAKALSSRIALLEGPNNLRRYTATDILQGYKWKSDPAAAGLILSQIEQYRETAYKHIRYLTGEKFSTIEGIMTKLKAEGDAAFSAGKKQGPIVIVDYLHLVRSREKIDLQELIKKILTELKGYAVEYNTCVFLISATNRVSNLTGSIGDSGARDSSNIEYSGDYMLSLNFWAVDEGIVKPSHQKAMDYIKSRSVRQMKLRVHKNRVGAPGKTANIYFYPAHNLFFAENDFYPKWIDEQNSICPFSPAAVRAGIEAEVGILSAPGNKKTDPQKAQSKTEAKPGRKPRQVTLVPGNN